MFPITVLMSKHPHCLEKFGHTGHISSYENNFVNLQLLSWIRGKYPVSLLS